MSLQKIKLIAWEHFLILFIINFIILEHKPTKTRPLPEKKKLNK